MFKVIGEFHSDVDLYDPDYIGLTSNCFQICRHISNEQLLVFIPTTHTFMDGDDSGYERVVRVRYYRLSIQEFELRYKINVEELLTSSCSNPFV